MARPLIAYESLIDGNQIISSPSDLAAFPVTNLQTHQPSEVYRVPDIATSGVNARLTPTSGTKDINVVAALHTNASETAEWLVQGWTSSPSAKIFDTGWVSMWPQSGLESYPFVHAVAVLAQTYAVTYVIVNFRDLSAPAGAVLDIGRLYVANAWQPAHHALINPGWAFGSDEAGAEAETLGGQTYRERRRRRRSIEFGVPFMTEAEAFDSAAAVERLAGASEPVMIVFNPASSRLMDMTYYGRQRELNPIASDAVATLTKRFRVVEM